MDPMQVAVLGWMNDMDVSKNRGTPKSSILIGFSIINHPFWGTPIFGNTHMERWNDSDIFHVAETIGHAKELTVVLSMRDPFAWVAMPTSHRRHIWGDLMRQPCNGAVRCSGSLKWPPADCLVAKWSFSSWNKGVLGVDYAAFFETFLCHESWVIMSFFTAEDDNANARYARSDPSDLQHCQWSVVVDVGFSYARGLFMGSFLWGYHMVK